MPISSPGVGSGLDVQSIVTQLVALERKPIEQLEAARSSLQTRLSTWGRIQSALGSLQDAARRLREPALWNERQATVTGSGVAASASSSASVGSFEVNVTQLASAQSVSTNTTLSSTAQGWEGRLRIALGSWSGTSFSAGSAPVEIVVNAGDTLQDIADRINSAGAGVTATVVNTGSGQRLAMRGANTGVENGFEVRAYDSTDTEITDGSGLGQLSFASGITSGMSGTLATDAQLSIDGIAVSSSSNTVSDAVQGVTLTLSAVTSGPATVSITADSDAVKDALEAFRTAYNDLNTLLRDATRADTSGEGNNGPLVGDQAAIGIQRALRNILGSTGPAGSPFGRLSDVGLELQRDGSLTTNNTRLATALADLSDLRTFMDDSNDGLATRMQSLMDRLLAFDGVTSSRSQGLQASIERKNDAIDRYEQRVARIESQLLAQYTRLDATLAGLNGLSTYLTQQLAQWNKG